MAWVQILNFFLFIKIIEVQIIEVLLYSTVHLKIYQQDCDYLVTPGILGVTQSYYNLVNILSGV